MRVKFQELLNEKNKPLNVTLDVTSTKVEQHNFTWQKSSTVLEVSF